MGLRAAVATAITTALLFVLGRMMTLPPTALVLGAAVSMLATVFANDVTARDQRITTALLSVPAVLCLVIGTLVSASAWLSVVAFLAVVFLSVALRRYGPRGTAVGMMSFNAF